MLSTVSILLIYAAGKPQKSASRGLMTSQCMRRLHPLWQPLRRHRRMSPPRSTVSSLLINAACLTSLQVQVR